MIPLLETLDTIDALLDSLLERREVVRRVLTGFPDGVGNYTDAHGTLPVFGSQWGRGVVFRDPNNNNEYVAVVGPGASSHAQLKQVGSREGLSVEKTVYFGFADGILYIEHGSVGRNVAFTRPILIEIAAAVAESGPLRGSAYKLSSQNTA